MFRPLSLSLPCSGGDGIDVAAVAPRAGEPRGPLRDRHVVAVAPACSAMNASMCSHHAPPGAISSLVLRVVAVLQILERREQFGAAIISHSESLLTTRPGSQTALRFEGWPALPTKEQIFLAKYLHLHLLRKSGGWVRFVNNTYGRRIRREMREFLACYSTVMVSIASRSI
jgi:hypothetical protein